MPRLKVTGPKVSAKVSGRGSVPRQQRYVEDRSGMAEGFVKLAEGINRRIERNARMDAEANVAQSRMDWQAKAAEFEASSVEGADGYTDNLMAEFDKYASESISKGKTKLAKEFLTLQYQEMKVQQFGRATKFEATERAKLHKKNVTDIIGHNSNIARADPEEKDVSLAQIDRAVDAMEGVNDTIRRGIRTEGRADVLLGHGQGLLARADTPRKTKEFIDMFKSSKEHQKGMRNHEYAGLLARAESQLRSQTGAVSKINLDALSETIRQNKAGTITETFDFGGIDVDDSKLRQLKNAFEDSKKTGRQVLAVGSMGGAELQAHLQGLQEGLKSPTMRDGEPMFDEKVDELTHVSRAVKQRLNAFKADQAAYAVQSSPDTGEAYTRLREAMKAGRPDPALATEYATLAMAEQERLSPGTKPKILTQQMLMEASTMINKVDDTPEGAENAVAYMAGLSDTWAHNWPVVQRQLMQEKVITGPMAVATRFVSDPSTRHLGTNLMVAARTGRKAYGERIAEQGYKKNVSTSINQAMAAFDATLVNNRDGSALIAQHHDAVELLALQDMANNGTGSSQAVEKAVDAVINQYYTMSDTFRVPRSAGVDAADMDAAGRFLLGAIDSVDLELPLAPESMDKAGQVKSVYAEQLKNNAFWVTNEDESGLLLIDGHGDIVRRADGSVFGFTWQELQTAIPMSTVDGELWEAMQ